MLHDFKETKRSKEELKIALSVIKEFESLESDDEWLNTPFICWSKLEQLESYLEELTTSSERVV